MMLDAKNGMAELASKRLDAYLTPVMTAHSFHSRQTLSAY